MGACNYIVAAVGKVKLSDVFIHICPFIGARYVRSRSFRSRRDHVYPAPLNL